MPWLPPSDNSSKPFTNSSVKHTISLHQRLDLVHKNRLRWKIPPPCLSCEPCASGRFETMFPNTKWTLLSSNTEVWKPLSNIPPLDLIECLSLLVPRTSCSTFFMEMRRHRMRRAVAQMLPLATHTMPRPLKRHRGTCPTTRHIKTRAIR